jgi:hypothetical protein
VARARVLSRAEVTVDRLSVERRALRARFSVTAAETKQARNAEAASPVGAFTETSMTRVCSGSRARTAPDMAAYSRA